MQFVQPSPRRLFLAWLLLTGMTVTSLLAGLDGWDPASTAVLGPASLAGILLATLLKAREILRIFLNLRASTAGWRGLMAAFVLLILGSVAAGQGLIALLGAGG